MSVSVASVARAVEVSLPGRRRRVRQRLRVLVEAVSGPVGSGVSTRDLVAGLAEYLAEPSGERVWFALAVLRAELPLAEDVVDAVRVARLDGGLAAVASALTGSRWVPTLGARDVRVVSDAVIVDVDHTSTVKFATGIQRVVRETVKRWVRDHDPLLVGWTADHTALRPLTDEQRHTTLTGEGSSRRALLDREVIVPRSGAYILPELTTSRSRTRRLAAMAEWSQVSTTAIGYDLVPISSAETAFEGMPGVFSDALVAYSRFDRLAAISSSAALEFAGWKGMLAGSGIPGPDVTAVELGSDSVPPSSAVPTRDVPLVLCVGSHEPRKNHAAVLFACERLWGAGLEFELLFVGGNGWHSERFASRVRELADLGFPVSTRSSVSDGELSALYTAAAFTVFVSLAEGYGLPVAESLRHGTPVITSDFGSMRDLAAPGGALLVDPRRTESVRAAIETLLTDDELRDRLGREAAVRRLPGWDEYAERVWQVAVGSAG